MNEEKTIIEPIITPDGSSDITIPFALKRDELVKEIKEKTLENEVLTNKNTELISSSNSMETELSTWKENLAVVRSEFAAESVIKEKEIASKTRELSRVDEKIALAKQEVEDLKSEKKTIGSEIKDINTFISDTKESLIGITSTLANFMSEMREEINTIKQCASDTQVKTEYFINSVATKEAEQLVVEQKHIAKENELNVREDAINKLAEQAITKK